MVTPKRPGLRVDSMQVRASIAAGSSLLALTMLYACSSPSPLPPPPSECQERCGQSFASGGSSSGGGTTTESDAGGGGTFADVNPPAFDGNL